MQPCQALQLGVRRQPGATEMVCHVSYTMNTLVENSWSPDAHQLSCPPLQ